MNKMIAAFALLMFVTVSSYSSFEYVLNTPGKVLALHVKNQDIYAGVENSGVRLSSNNGTTWEDVANNMGQISVYRFLSIGNDIYAATALGVYKTTNRGMNVNCYNKSKYG